MSLFDLVILCAPLLCTSTSPVKDTPAVQLNVYFESCCSDCQNFITGTYKQAFYDKDWTNMTNITLVPGGKSNETYNAQTDSYDFSCQHGSTECKGNIYLACAVSALYELNPLKYSPFIINFLEEVMKEQKNDIYKCPQVDMDNVAKIVCDAFGDDCDWNALSECHDGKMGNELYHQFVAQTHAQVPSLNWVPWIVLQGQHTQSEQDSCQANVLNCTCSAYEAEGGISDVCA